MSLEKLANNAISTLNGAINNSVTSLVVTSAANFPSSGNFHVIVEDEIMLVTAVSGTTFTVTRAQESTTAASHASGVDIALILTAASILNLIRQYSKSPYLVFEPTGVDDEFDDSSFSGWTKVANATPVITESEDGSQLSLVHPGGGSAGQLIAYMKSTTINTGDKIEMCFRMAQYDENFAIVALVMADGATYGSGNQVLCTFSPQQNLLSMMSHTNYNSNASNTTYSMRQQGTGYVFLRLTYVSANTFKGEVSIDGIQWFTFNSSFSRTITPTHVGFAITKWGGSNFMLCTLEYFRKR
jgi:hypothetical protein